MNRMIFFTYWRYNGSGPFISCIILYYSGCLCIQRRSYFVTWSNAKIKQYTVWMASEWAFRMVLWHARLCLYAHTRILGQFKIAGTHVNFLPLMAFYSLCFSIKTNENGQPVSAPVEQVWISVAGARSIKCRWAVFFRIYRGPAPKIITRCTRSQPSNPWKCVDIFFWFSVLELIFRCRRCFVSCFYINIVVEFVFFLRLTIFQIWICSNTKSEVSGHWTQ